MWIAIPVRSRRQAMDWSLVLASQGIEVVIDHQPEGAGWTLRVDALQHPAALAVIRQYRLENRHWALRQKLHDWGFSFHAAAFVGCWVLVLFHGFAEAFDGRLELAGEMNGQVAASGQWWRLITATMLHADVGHLAANVSTGVLVLGLAMGRYGWGWASLAGLLAGAAGNLAGLLLHEAPYRGLGASGVLMGALGLLTVQSLALWHNVRAARRSVLAGLFAGALLFVLLGLNPRSDVVAHAGGYVAGVAQGVALNFLPPRFGAKSLADHGAGVVAILLASGAWILALSH